jgi:hypothetical protein
LSFLDLNDIRKMELDRRSFIGSGSMARVLSYPSGLVTFPYQKAILADCFVVVEGTTRSQC